MPRVRCFELDGVHLFFFTNDHDPPHFHAEKRGEWHYRVNFQLAGPDMFEQKAGPRELRGKARRALQSLVEAHRLELLEEWEASRSDD